MSMRCAAMEPLLDPPSQLGDPLLHVHVSFGVCQGRMRKRVRDENECGLRRQWRAGSRWVQRRAFNGWSLFPFRYCDWVDSEPGVGLCRPIQMLRLGDSEPGVGLRLFPFRSCVWVDSEPDVGLRLFSPSLFGDAVTGLRSGWLLRERRLLPPAVPVRAGLPVPALLAALLVPPPVVAGGRGGASASSASFLTFFFVFLVKLSGGDGERYAHGPLPPPPPTHLTGLKSLCGKGRGGVGEKTEREAPSQGQHDDAGQQLTTLQLRRPRAPSAFARPSAGGVVGHGQGAQPLCWRSAPCLARYLRPRRSLLRHAALVHVVGALGFVSCDLSRVQVGG